MSCQDSSSSNACFQYSRSDDGKILQIRDITSPPQGVLRFTYYIEEVPDIDLIAFGGIQGFVRCWSLVEIHLINVRLFQEQLSEEFSSEASLIEKQSIIGPVDCKINLQTRYVTFADGRPGQYLRLFDPRRQKDFVMLDIPQNIVDYNNKQR